MGFGVLYDQPFTGDAPGTFLNNHDSSPLIRTPRQVVDVFLTSRDQYDIAEYKLSNVEWLILEDYEAVLEVSTLFLVFEIRIN